VYLQVEIIDWMDAMEERDPSNFKITPKVKVDMPNSCPFLPTGFQGAVKRLFQTLVPNDKPRGGLP